MTGKVEITPKCLVKLVEAMRARFSDGEFKQRHRKRPQDFTRHRSLTFEVVMVGILRKTLKSVQRHLNELLRDFAQGKPWEALSPRAWSLGREKLLPSAFVELNQQVVVPAAYAEEVEQRRWHGKRLIGLDGSTTWLPYSPSLAQEFEVCVPQNQLGVVGSRYCEGRLSVVYDLLNRIGLDGRLVSSRVGEVALAREQLAYVGPGDVVLVDCGFTGFEFLAQNLVRGADFVARCSEGSFKEARELFEQGTAGQSRVVRLRAPERLTAELKERGLPLEITVRFVSVGLPDGSLEVLVTSLLDEVAFPTGEFTELYHCRWGQETYYGLLKSRLDLENWSGLSAEAVAQDFTAAVLLCNLESLLTRPAQQQLDRKNEHNQHPQQVNRAVSCHTLKSHLVQLLASNLPAEEVIGQLQKLFQGSPIPVRPQRQVPRLKRSFCRSHRFQKCRRKIVF